MKQVWIADEYDVFQSLQGGPIYEGLFTSPGEPDAIESLIAAGKIERFYEGVGGLMGLAKLRIAKVSE